MYRSIRVQIIRQIGIFSFFIIIHLSSEFSKSDFYYDTLKVQPHLWACSLNHHLLRNKRSWRDVATPCKIKFLGCKSIAEN